MDTKPAAPNHHAHFPPFTGVLGLAAAATMLVGREGYARLAVQLGGLSADDTVVDIGCWSGDTVRHAARIGASAIGVDPAPVMLRVAGLVTARTERARFVQGSAESVPLLERLFTQCFGKPLRIAAADPDRAVGPGGQLCQ